jgi:protein translocase SecG subunit
MNSVLLISQIILAIALTLLIIVQAKGKGFVRGFGGGGNSFTRRGLEQVVFKLTFVVAALFIIVSFLPLVIN